jgi:hypothetical protein
MRGVPTGAPHPKPSTWHGNRHELSLFGLVSLARDVGVLLRSVGGGVRQRPPDTQSDMR